MTTPAGAGARTGGRRWNDRPRRRRRRLHGGQRGLDRRDRRSRPDRRRHRRAGARGRRPGAARLAAAQDRRQPARTGSAGVRDFRRTARRSGPTARPRSAAAAEAAGAAASGGQGRAGATSGGCGQCGADTNGGPGRAGAGREPAGPVQYVDAGELGDVDVDGTALLDSLDSETLERRRGTRRKGRPAGRYLMVVHVRADGFAHIGVLEGRQLIEHYVSSPTDDNTSIDGNIYLGRVQNVLPGMEAAFIDIGTPKNGVLYHGDVAFDESEVDGGEKPRIERVLRNGQAIIVQVTKNPIAHKGARLTQEVSLAGPVRRHGAGPTADVRHLEAASRRRAQAPAPRPRPVASRRRGADRAHRGRGCDRGRARARHAAPERAVAADLGDRQEGEAGQPPLQGAAARDPPDPRGVHEGVPRRRHRRRARCTKK